MSKFRRFITVEVPSTSRDATYGTPTGDWTALVYEPGSPQVAAKWPVEWMPMMPSKAEATWQGLNAGKQQVRVRMRHRSDITNAMRVRLYGDTDSIWHIVGIAEIEGRKGRLELVVEKYSTEGGNG